MDLVKKDNDIEAILASLMLGTGKGIDLLRMGVGFVSALDANDCFALVDNRLRLRCLHTTPEASLGNDFWEDQRPFYEDMYKSAIGR